MKKRTPFLLKNIRFTSVLLILFLFLSLAKSQPVIVYPENASAAEVLAAKEVRRYIYLRTEALLDMKDTTELPDNSDVILLATDDHPMIHQFRQELNDTVPQSGFILKTITQQNRNVLIISGFDCQAVLNGAYRFAEHLGVSYDLAGDILPDSTVHLNLQGFDEKSQPLLPVRGIQPFHDFFQGPDLWSADDYRTIISQLTKLGMNFIGLHTYPTWSVTEEKDSDTRQGPEPTVWIGLEEDIRENGDVTWSYPAYYAHSHRPNRIWGYDTLGTHQFHAGASDIFPYSAYGSDVFEGQVPTELNSNEIFNNTGRMLNKAFSHAQRLNVKTALGTELPLGLEPGGPEVGYDWIRVMPPELQSRLIAMGKDPASPEVVKEVYRAIFKRIASTHPLDYYWLWTWEVWSMYGVSNQQIQAFERDIQLAHEALDELDAPFQLALAGWIIGTVDDPNEFEDAVPPEVPIFGLWDEADGFEELSPERVKWPATWLEEDWGLIQPQLELHRIYDDIFAAVEKQCNGMIAKHWRTRVLGATTGAMKDLLWRRGPTGSALQNPFSKSKNEWIDSFYLDWAQHQFGPHGAAEIAQIFASLDKAGEPGKPGAMPVVSDWESEREDSNNGAPGAIPPNEERVWQEEKQKYEFVNALEAVRVEIRGKGNQERFDYWLKTMQAMRTMAEYSCTRFLFEEAMEQEAWNDALDHRIKLARLFEDIITLQIEKATNVSDLGEIMNMEILNWHQLMSLKWDDKLIAGTGADLPADAYPGKIYTGEPGIKLITKNNYLFQGDTLKLDIAIMGEHSAPEMLWRNLGTGQFNSAPLSHVSGSRYTIALEGIMEDIELFIRAKGASETLYYPPGAPEINYTVVVQDPGCRLCEAADTMFNPPDLTHAESFKEQKLMVYPNPAGTQLRIQPPFEEEAIIQLRNMYGNLLLKKEYNGNNQQEINIPVSNIPPGIYFLSLNNHSNQISGKVIISR